jgi:A/G-specific adenine glycosylase
MLNKGGRSARFVSALLKWNDVDNQREMPWKNEKDPYKIWLSEVILQQTRVEQGRAYYERFIKSFPTIIHLANAPEREVMKLWEGLGYYSRCRNLIQAARFIVDNYKGAFPRTYEKILALKGVGPYTAAAIASFAFNLPHAVLDGNVYRVLSRVFDIETAIDSSAGKQQFVKLADELLPARQPGIFNQAIMDFGAVICKPLPLCAECFFNRHCAAFLMGKQAILPVKEKKLVRRTRWFHYIIARNKNSLLIRQRPAGDIWQSLFEPILIEAPKNLPVKKIVAQFEKEFSISSAAYIVNGKTTEATQKLTHQQIHFSFIEIELEKKFRLPGYEWVAASEIINYPFPKTIKNMLCRERKG